MRRIIQDLDDRDARLGRIGKTEHIILPVRTEAEAERDEHQQAEQSIEEGPPHHGRWQNARSILELLRHVSASVWTEETPQGRRDADEDREARVAPAAIILELREDLLGRCMLARNPQDDQEDEEADDVDDHEYTFCQRKLSRAEDVEGSRGDEEKHDE